MTINVGELVRQLRGMTVPELRRKHAEVFGEPARSSHKQHLVRRIAWRIQALEAWVGAALVSVIALWPAIWVAPMDVWQTVYNWINQSAEAGSILETLSPDFSEGFPDLGVFYYPVNWLLKTTPLMMLGLLFFIFWWRRTPPASQARWWAGRLLLWIGLFSLMLTLGDKRDGRYLLPVYFALCILAALGLQFLYNRLRHLRPFSVKLGAFQTNAYQLGFVIFLLGFSVTFYPYYLTYYNPLAGGSWLAAKLVRVGWGDGMEEALQRMESGEDTEQIEAEMGDLLESEDPFQIAAKKGGKGGKRTAPKRDETLYDL